MTTLTELAALETDIRAWAVQRIDPVRIVHVEGVVTTAAQLAARYAPDDIARVRLAGWLHDAAKNWEDARLLAYAEAHDWYITPCERAVPLLLHGAVGYALAAEQFGLDDDLLREACALHTTGAPGMRTAAKIVFIADFVEPSRPAHRVGKLREIMFEDLDVALLMTIDSVLLHLVKRQRLIDPRAFGLHNDLVAAGVSFPR